MDSDLKEPIAESTVGDAVLDPGALTELVTMLVPVKGRDLLIPNMSVAEVVRLDALQTLDNVPDWIAGRILWRGLDIPLISYEALNDAPFAAASEHQKAVVLNSAADGNALPFYAIIAAGTPRILRVAPDEIMCSEEADLGPAELMAVNVSGEEACIPKLEWIEQQLLGVRALCPR